MSALSTFGMCVLWGSGTYHALVGVFSLSSVKVTKAVGKKLYALEFPEKLDPRYEYTLKPLGAYALFVAAFSIFAARSAPFSVQLFALQLLAALFVLRSISRLIYHRLLTEAFNIPLKRSLLNVAFNCGLALAMLF